MQREVARAFWLTSRYVEDYSFLRKGQFRTTEVQPSHRSTSGQRGLRNSSIEYRNSSATGLEKK